jgi:hypothetical protein
VFGAASGSDLAGSNGLIRQLRAPFVTFGVPEELSSNGGPEFRAAATQDFLQRWGVHHRLSLAQSNGRAEVAVKTAKRLLLSNLEPGRSLSQDSFLRAMLQLRNTPDPDCSLSPAQIVFGHLLRDAFSLTGWRSILIQQYAQPGEMHGRQKNRL